MEKLYAQALWISLEKGTSPKDAIEALVNLLKKQGRADLLPKIGKAFARLSEAKKSIRPRIYVARHKDAATAVKHSGLKDPEIVVDESLIGGWRMEGNGELVDRSFKKYLLDIYNSAIAA